MKFYQNKKFAVISFSDQHIRGVLFRCVRDGVEVVSRASETISPEDPFPAWKNVLKQMGRGKDYPLYLTGALRDGICFDTRLADLAPRFQKQAIEIDLPRHMISVPDHVRFQFFPLTEPENGTRLFRVYAVPSSSFEPIAAMLTQGSCRADGFLYPALALQKDDPPFVMPEMEPDLCFCGGVWKKMNIPADLFRQWREKLGKEIKLKEKEEDFRDYLAHFVAARMILKQNMYPGLQILPGRITPKRIREQLKITGILAVILILNILWSCSGNWKSDFREMQSLQQNITRLQQENSELKRKLKSKEKMQKELTRLVNLKAGEENLAGKLADLSAVLPMDFQTTSLRWNDGGVELQLQGLDVQTDLSGAFRSLPYWKIGQLQQRRFGNSESIMITLKLIPAEGKE